MPATSNATPGSDPKSKPLFVRAVGRGRSTPENVVPASVENIARIGSRWISFEPAMTLAVLAGLIAIDSSLCDPHSLLASTLVPKVCCGTVPVLPSHSGTTPLDTTRNFWNHEAFAYAFEFELAASAGIGEREQDGGCRRAEDLPAQRVLQKRIISPADQRRIRRT